MKKAFLYIIVCLAMFFTSCQHDTSLYDNLLSETLWHYQHKDKNKEKEEAATFLIENMKFHHSKGHNIEESQSLKNWMLATDSLYHHFSNKGPIDEDFAERLNTIKKHWGESAKHAFIKENIINDELQNDTDVISSQFLIEHIDHAFYIWKNNDIAKGLSFEEFKEYILPYRAINTVGFPETGKNLYKLFNKYVFGNNAPASAEDRINSYNKAIYELRDMNGRLNLTHHNGVYDIYSRDFCDCIDMANYGTLILRACGLPVATEFNICYRSLVGRHYFCSYYDFKNKTWESFNPESTVPGEKDWAFAETGNVYRATYAAQRNTPYFLRNKNEYIPQEFNDPCIKDVTDYLCPTTSITISCNIPKSNKLAYLATFNKANGGIVPVTWGFVNHKEHTVTFTNALTNMIYFPVYYLSEKIETFGNMFFIDKEHNVCDIPFTNTENSERTNIILTRKYPRKPNMIEIADNLVGSKILGANKDDFSDAEELLTISNPLQPHLQRLNLTKNGKYKFYRFQASAEHPNANISMLEWITSKDYGYANVEKPSRTAILSPKDTNRTGNNMVKLLDAPSWADMATKSEYDGNMQSAPGAYPNITLKLKEPQIVTAINIAPLNADNGIKPENVYELYYWDNEWKSAGRKTAKYEFIEFGNVPSNKMYWLRNLSEGEEEMPFVINNGKQIFFYSDIVPLSKP